MSKHDALYIERFQPRGRKPKRVKAKKARKAVRNALRFYQAMFEKYDLKG